MKKYMIGFVIILSVLVGQDKYQFFLKSDDNLKLAGEENYNIIKAELDKMLADYNSKIDLDNFWEEEYQVKVIISQTTDDVAVANAMLNMHNPSQADYDLARAYATKTVYGYETRKKNRTIERGETLFTKEAE